MRHAFECKRRVGNKLPTLRKLRVSISWRTNNFLECEGHVVNTKILVVFLAIALSGCATTGGAVHEVPPGPEPSRGEAERVVKELLRVTLKDPDSVKTFTLSSVNQTRYYTGLLGGNYWEGGWRVCFEYNAKNSYGAYVGLKRTGIVIRCRDADHCEYLSSGGGFESTTC